MFLVLVLWAFTQTTISEVVGQAGGQAVTSREVEADVIFTSLYQKVDKPNYPLPLKGKALQSATSNLLMEVLITLEAESFRLANVSDSDVDLAIEQFQRNIVKTNLQKQWKNLEMSKEDLRTLAKRKLRAMRFLEFKKTSFVVVPTDEEIRDYFEKRKTTFSGKTYQEIKSTVEKRLQQEKIDQSLREWFQILRSKYEIRNLLIES